MRSTPSTSVMRQPCGTAYRWDGLKEIVEPRRATRDIAPCVGVERRACRTLLNCRWLRSLDDLAHPSKAPFRRCCLSEDSRWKAIEDGPVEPRQDQVRFTIQPGLQIEVPEEAFGDADWHLLRVVAEEEHRVGIHYTPRGGRHTRREATPVMHPVDQVVMPRANVSSSSSRRTRGQASVTRWMSWSRGTSA